MIFKEKSNWCNWVFNFIVTVWHCSTIYDFWGHGGRAVTLSTPTSAAGDRFPAQPQVGKLVVAAIGRQFTVKNPDKLCVLVSSALPTTRRDMTCTVLKAK